MDFDDLVFELAEEKGSEEILEIPGVWELFVEYYEKDLMKRVEDERGCGSQGKLGDMDVGRGVKGT